VSLVWTVKVWGARSKEKQLHDKFSASRFTWTKAIGYKQWLQPHYKIGIAKNVESRIRAINKDPTKSGQTEWFALTWLEVCCVLGWFAWFKYALYIRLLFNLAWVSLFLLCVYLES
jgi:hypothetical protein